MANLKFKQVMETYGWEATVKTKRTTKTTTPARIMMTRTDFLFAIQKNRLAKSSQTAQLILKIKSQSK